MAIKDASGRLFDDPGDGTDRIGFFIASSAGSVCTTSPMAESLIIRIFMACT